MANKYKDWEPDVRAFLGVFKIGVPRDISTTEIAAEAGIQPFSVSTIRILLMHIGAMEQKFVVHGKGSGRRAVLTVHFTYPEIMAEMKRLKLEFGQPAVEKIAKAEGKLRGPRGSYKKRDEVKPATPSPVFTEAGTGTVKQGDKTDFRQQPFIAPGGPVTITHMPSGLASGHTERVPFPPRGQEPVKPVTTPTNGAPEFQVLRPMLKDEPKALVELARSYRDRKSFIDEKIEEFARHGMTLTLDAIGMEADVRLEHIALILPYIDALERANSRMTGSIPASGEVQELRNKIREMERLNTERAEKAERHLRETKDRYAAKERQLEADIERFKSQIRNMPTTTVSPVR